MNRLNRGLHAHQLWLSLPYTMIERRITAHCIVLQNLKFKIEGKSLNQELSQILISYSEGVICPETWIRD